MLGARHAAFIAAFLGVFVAASSTAAGVSVIQSNSTASPGEFWVEGSKMHWTDGSSEYALPHYSGGGPSQPGSGHVWVENGTIRFRGSSGYEGSCTAPKETTHANIAFEGDTWVEDGKLRYIDGAGAERSLPDPIDEFEDGDPLTDDYGGSTGAYSYVTTPTLPESQEALVGSGTGNRECIRANNTGTIRDNDSISFHFRTNSTRGGIASLTYNTYQNTAKTACGQSYRVVMDIGGDEARIEEPGGKFSQPTTLANASITWSAAEWYTITLTRKSTDDDDVRVYDKDMNQEASLKATSTQDGCKYYSICHKSNKKQFFDDIDKSCTER